MPPVFCMGTLPLSHISDIGSSGPVIAFMGTEPRDRGDTMVLDARHLWAGPVYISPSEAFPWLEPAVTCLCINEIMYIVD